MWQNLNPARVSRDERVISNILSLTSSWLIRISVPYTCIYLYTGVSRSVLGFSLNHQLHARARTKYKALSCSACRQIQAVGQGKHSKHESIGHQGGHGKKGKSLVAVRVHHQKRDVCMNFWLDGIEAQPPFINPITRHSPLVHQSFPSSIRLKASVT